MFSCHCLFLTITVAAHPTSAPDVRKTTLKTEESVAIRSAAITHNLCIRLSVDFHPPAVSHKNSVTQLVSKACISSFGGGGNQEHMLMGLKVTKGFPLCALPVLTSSELESAKWVKTHWTVQKGLDFFLFVTLDKGHSS